MALLLLANGMDEEERQFLMDGLNLSNQELDEVNQQMQDTLHTFDNLNSTELKTANSFWYKEEYTVNEEYEILLDNYYHGETYQMAHIDPEKEMNAWVKDKTNGLIPKIIDRLEPREIAFLLNAIYFNGKWQQAFDESQTYNETFHLLNGRTKEHPIMKQEGTFPYLDGDSYQAVKLPYEDEGLHMAVVLPDEGQFLNVVSDLDSSFFTTTEWKQTELEVGLPTFSFSGDYSLRDQLETLGLGQMFTENLYLREMFDRVNEDPEFKVSRVLHKSIIDVDEQGTEAAAVTGIGIMVESSEVIEIKPFIVDRPFIFAIVDDTTETVLFMGSVIEPVTEKN